MLVQAAASEAETAYLLDLADRHPFVGTVVGWVDLARAESAATLARWCEAHSALRGVRPMLQDLAAADWIAHAPHPEALRALQRLGLRFDALVRPRELEALLRFVRAWPELPVVIDHAAKPCLAEGWTAAWADPWRARMAELAACPNVMCKFSGLLTEAPPGADANALRPAWDHLLQLLRPRAPHVGQRLAGAHARGALRGLGRDQRHADRRTLARRAGRHPARQCHPLLWTDMDLELKDKPVLVTGGGSGIGAAIALALAREGAIPVVLGREPLPEALANALRAAQPRTLDFQLELADEAACRDAVARSVAMLGGLHGLVNNAGVNDRVGLDAGPGNFARPWSATWCLPTPWRTCACRRCAPAGAPSSTSPPRWRSPARAAPAATRRPRAGCSALTREWAVDLLADGIRVNAVVPAEVMTPLYQRWLEGFDDPRRAARRSSSAFHWSNA